MRLSYYLFILIFSFLLLSCSNHKSDFDIEKNVIITGKISGYDLAEYPSTIMIHQHDIVNSNQFYCTSIEKNGCFKFSFPISYAQELWIDYDGLNSISLVVRLGDSLFIAIDNEFLLQYDTDANFFHFENDEIGKTNLAVNKFINKNINPEEFWQRTYDALENLQPEEYVKFLYNQDSVLTENFNSYVKDHNTTPLFNTWCRDKIHYYTLNYLMRYRCQNPSNYKLPDDYFSFLADYDMDDNQIFSISHSDFLHELFMYYWDKPDNPGNSREQNYKILTDTIKANSAGFTQEFLLTKVYMNTLKGQLIDVFEAIYDSTDIHQTYFRNAIDNKYKELKKYLSNQNTGSINLTTIQSQTLEEFLDTITQKYQDKIIYIDFWAPWCSPCMEEMPYSHTIQEHYRGNDNIVFLYLAHGCTKESWRATIANKKLTGEHILLTNDQYNLLADLFDISGIPHYSLIDKKGNVVLKDAPRPSEKDIIIKEIERQLNK